MQNAVFILIDLGILALIGHGVKLREGDWSRYGKELGTLKSILDRLAKLAR